MEYINIVEYIMLGLYIAISFIAWVVTIIDTIKEKKKAKAEALLNQTAQEVDAAARNLIEEAETFTNYTGTEKLNWVVTRLKQLNQKLYGEAELISLVNQIVSTTKKVNNKNNEGGENGK